MESQQNLEDDSVKDKDLAIETLIDWVKSHGGICNVEARRDRVTGVRGLYSLIDIKDDDTPLV